MIDNLLPRRHANHLRWRQPPWDEHHPDWRRLDRELPADHRVRLIERLVDQLDCQPWLLDFCAGFGAAAYPPQLFLKIMLYELDQQALSPAHWWRHCQESLPLRWLTRGACPSRAVLYDARRRLSPAILWQLNQQLLQQVRTTVGLPSRASLDGTFVAAKGSRHHLLNLQRLDKRLGQLQQAVDADANGLVFRRPSWMASSVAGRSRQQQRYQKARERLASKLQRHQQQQSRRAKTKRRSGERVVISVSEPEAAIGKDKLKVVRPLYNVQLVRALDGPWLLGYGVFAAVSDAGLLPPMLERVRALTGTVPHELLADGIYASVLDLKVCQEQHVRLYAPVGAASPQGGRVPLPVVAAPVTADPAAPNPSRPAKGYYGKEQFVWDEATQTYVCPAGERLQRVSRGHETRGAGQVVGVDKYGTKACASCAQRPQCTRSKRGRQLKRLVDEPLVEELRQRMQTAAGKELYRQRKSTIELAFADLKEHRGLRRLCGYGVEQAEAVLGLLVLLHNGKALLQQRQAVATATT
jgi:DDE family transposase